LQYLFTQDHAAPIAKRAFLFSPGGDIGRVLDCLRAAFPKGLGPQLIVDDGRRRHLAHPQGLELKPTAGSTPQRSHEEDVIKISSRVQETEFVAHDGQRLERRQRGDTTVHRLYQMKEAANFCARINVNDPSPNPSSTSVRLRESGRRIKRGTDVMVAGKVAWCAVMAMSAKLAHSCAGFGRASFDELIDQCWQAAMEGF